MTLTYTEVVGVYHADGGLRGELAYVVGKLMGRVHCALCDITHSPVRRKAEWDAFAARLSIPITLLHLNELTPELAGVVDGRSPVVLGRRVDQWLRLVEPAQLDSLGGSVTAFESVLSRALGSA